MKTLIKNAHVVTPGEIARIAVIIENGRIACVDAAIHARAEETIDAAGLYLIPGAVDDQVHFREPGMTHKEDLATASRACAAGGVTTFLEMPNTIPPALDRARLAEKYALAAAKSLVNFGFYIGASPDNLAELQAVDPTCTPGIKIFLGSSTGNLLVDDQDALERIFEQTTLPICAHCEDETIVRRNAQLYRGRTDYAAHSLVRDREAAVVAARRAIDLAHRHRHRFHLLHASTEEEASMLADHRDLITGEACPHHLLFNVDDYERLGSLIQMNPSVKTAADNRALWDALHAGLIQVVATDHAPHTLEEKSKPYPQSPSGLPAVENSLALMLNEVNQDRATLAEVVRWMCDAPARVWDLVGKGRIEESYDADLVLIDLHRKRVVRNAEQLTKAGWSPWDGVALTGWPVRTWVLGREVWRDGVFDADLRGRAILCDHVRGGYWRTQS